MHFICLEFNTKLARMPAPNHLTVVLSLSQRVKEQNQPNQPTEEKTNQNKRKPIKSR